MSARTAIAACVIALTVSGSRATAQSPDAAADCSRLFAAYARGGFDEAAAAVEHTFSSSAALAAFAAALRLHIVADPSVIVPLWPRETGAAFALESASAAINRAADDPSEFDVGFAGLLDDGRDALRRRSPTPFDVTWHLAALALILGPPSDMRASGVGTASLQPGSALSQELDAEADDIATRHVDASDLSLALGIAREAEVRAWISTRGPVSSKGVDPEDALAKAPSDVRRWLAEAATDFSTARSDRRFIGMATVHLGTIAAYRGRPDDAIALWRSVPSRTTDSSVRYLAALQSGALLAREGRAQEAIAELQAAVRLRPGAQAAGMSLAVAFLVAGQPEAAADAAEPILVSVTPADDPWWRYEDLRWPDRLDALRASLAARR